MTNQLTQAQMDWAARHDWFVMQDAQGLIVADRWVDTNGKYHENHVRWEGTFRELRDWAGY